MDNEQVDISKIVNVLTFEKIGNVIVYHQNFTISYALFKDELLTKIQAATDNWKIEEDNPVKDISVQENGIYYVFNVTVVESSPSD